MIRARKRYDRGRDDATGGGGVAERKKGSGPETSRRFRTSRVVEKKIRCGASRLLEVYELGEFWFLFLRLVSLFPLPFFQFPLPVSGEG